jgi:protein-L-isoaspartate O-methyltransferase
MNEADQIESWLDPEDIPRLWAVVHGELPETAATADEITELLRITQHAAMLKMGGSGYQTAVLQ